MTEFRVEATWCDDGVHVQFGRIEPFEPDHAAHLIEIGMLKPDDELVGNMQIGEFVVDYPDGAFPKKVRRAALDWLEQNAGMTADDSFELQHWAQDIRELLARLETAVSRWTAEAPESRTPSGR